MLDSDCDDDYGCDNYDDDGNNNNSNKKTVNLALCINIIPWR
jgi:hypothetical protein